MKKLVLEKKVVYELNAREAVDNTPSGRSVSSRRDSGRSASSR